MILAGTGLDSFTDPEGITALYPFPGWEWLLVVVGALLLLGWHVVQMRDENKEYDEAIRLYERVGMERAMNFSGRTHLDTDQDIEAAQSQLDAGHDSVNLRDSPTSRRGTESAG